MNAIILPGFHHHPICAAANITHLAYANDFLLFARGDESTITLIVDYLKIFVEIDGLWANPPKYSRG